MKYIYLFIFFLMFNTRVYSQWSTDPSVNIRVTNGGLLPQIITDGSGGAYIVYQDSPALLRQVWVQWLDKYGFVRFPDNGIRISNADRYQTPYYYLVSDRAGGVIVVFNYFLLEGDEDTGERFFAVYAQRIDSSGTKLWGDAGIEVSPLADDKSAVSACSDGENGVFVFWGEDDDSNGAFELRAQRITAAGQFAWPDTGVVVTDKFIFDNISNPNPAVSDGARNAIILYSDSSQTDFDTRLQKLSAEGEFLWGEGVSIFQVGRHIIADNSGGVIVAGVRREFDGISVQYIVGANRVDASGQVLWGERGIELVNSLRREPQAPRMTLDSHNRLYCVWSDKRTDTLNVYLQRLGPGGGSLLKDSGLPVSRVKSEKGNAFVFCNDESGVTVVFGDNREPDGFYAQKIDSLGNRGWNGEDILISARLPRPPMQVTSDLAGGAILCWYETGVGSGFGIFAQQVSRNGNLGEILVTSVSQPHESHMPTQYILHQSYPNPFNAEMMIKYEIPESNLVTLTIYDITGKEVIRLINKNQGPGVYKARWNGKNQKGGDVASGIYIYQLRTGSFVANKKAIFIK